MHYAVHLIARIVPMKWIPVLPIKVLIDSIGPMGKISIGLTNINCMG